LIVVPIDQLWNGVRTQMPGSQQNGDKPVAPKPLIGVLCCNEVAERPVQTVASRFIDPLVHISQASVLLVPALVAGVDIQDIAGRLDGLLLTGSRSNVSPHHYGGSDLDMGRTDQQRDEVALRLAGTLIESGKPVFGICRGLQELNVLFGGSLRDMESGAHHQEDNLPYHELFDHMHDVDLMPGGRLTNGGPGRRVSVNSVHMQGVDRLASGLSVEAVSALDGVIEAVSARPLEADVLAVQGHPEWAGAQCEVSKTFFNAIGEALRSQHQRS
jgi:putative glutamine amidotransferase